jgi:hypothetical protein
MDLGERPSTQTTNNSRRSCGSWQPIEAVGSEEVKKSRRATKTIDRKTVTGPWVAVNGPMANGKSATNKIASTVQKAAIRLDRSNVSTHSQYPTWFRACTRKGTLRMSRQSTQPDL